MPAFPRWLLSVIALGTWVGCSPKYDDGIEFATIEQSQTPTLDDFSELVFTDASGAEVKLTDVMKKRFLVLVVTRGWTGAICLYCSSQTSSWAARHDELNRYDSELIVVFPTETEADTGRVEDLRKKVRDRLSDNETIPFPIFLDIALESVDKLGIRAELAKPATYIIDNQGRVRFAYVGQSIADRPSVDSILNQLERMND